MSWWQQFPLSAKVSGGLVLLFCALDFSQRVWIETDVNTREFNEFAASDYVVPAPQQAEEIQTWLAQRKAAAEAQQEAQNAQTEQTEPTPLLEGGVNVGDVRVRVRATYAATNETKQIALIEVQQQAARTIEITTIEVGYAISNFSVNEINVSGVQFTATDGTSVFVPVFDY